MGPSVVWATGAAVVDSSLPIEILSLSRVRERAPNMTTPTAIMIAAVVKITEVLLFFFLGTLKIAYLNKREVKNN
jgi:hypothetical protein